MNLKNSLFASLAMLALAVPVTGGAFVFVSASPALAKSDKDKGGSGRGSDRGSRSDRGKSDRGRGSASQGRSGTGGGNGNGNAYGAGNGNSGGSSGSVKPAKATTTATVEPESLDGEVALRPNQLGSMNGAMNANINAVLAHIRNGNTNGPVGALAGLAVAEHNAAEAETLLETAGDFAALDEALEAAGYEDLQTYLDSGETDGNVDAAIAALGDAAGTEPPTEEEIAEAEAALAALPEAETAIFDAWNKSGSATEEEKQALLDALRDRLDGEDEAIAAAIEAAVDRASETDGDTEAEADGEGEGDEVDDGESDAEEEGGDEGAEETAALDPEAQAMIDGLKY